MKRMSANAEKVPLSAPPLGAPDRARGGIDFRFLCLDAVGQPHLDDRLAGHTDKECLFIEFGNHPTWQNDIGALLFVQRRLVIQ